MTCFVTHSQSWVPHLDTKQQSLRSTYMVLILFNPQGVLHFTKRGVVVVGEGSVTVKVDIINSIKSLTTK